MGKGFNNYMTKKFFHPSSKENIKRVWMAQQKSEFEKNKQEELLAQYQKEQDMLKNRAMLGDEKAKIGLSFMYDAPPGLKKKEQEEEQAEVKFEWQRKYNAPREQYAKNDEMIRDQPFGIEVRNVRCIKCRKWGHVNTDRICPLFGKDLTAEPPQPESNASSLLQSMQEDGFTLKQSILGRMSDPTAANEQLLDSGDEDDPEVQFLKSLTPKQKKKLLKKLNKLQTKGSGDKKKKKKKKKRASLSDSDAEGKRRKKKKASVSSYDSSDSENSDNEADHKGHRKKATETKKDNRHRDATSKSDRREESRHDKHRNDEQGHRERSRHNVRKRSKSPSHSDEKYKLPPPRKRSDSSELRRENRHRYSHRSRSRSSDRDMKTNKYSGFHSTQKYRNRSRSTERSKSSHKRRTSRERSRSAERLRHSEQKRSRDKRSRD